MTRSECLDEAKKCVCGEREKQYGSPENNFSTIAGLWDEYMNSQGYRVHFTKDDVAAMMILLKVARIAGGNYKADSWVDIAGYAACGCELGGIANEDREGEA